jgi:UDP-glucose 4-epimerase
MAAPERVLVTGASGYLGQHLVRQLSALGMAVRGLARRPPPVRSDIEWVQGDVTDPDQVRSAMQDCDAVVHLACVPLNLSQDDPVTAFEINGVGTLNILQSAYERANVDVIYTSTAQVYGPGEQLPLADDHPVNPNSPYAAGKLWGEIACQTYARRYGVPVTILRIFNVYGLTVDGCERPTVETIFIRKVLEGQPPLIKGHPQTGRDFIHIDDVIRCLILALLGPKQGEIINVGTGVLTTLRDLARTIIELSGVSMDPIVQSEPEQAVQLCADMTKADQILGFQPRITLEAGLHQILDHMTYHLNNSGSVGQT